jgi:hypothetical protein
MAPRPLHFIRVFYLLLMGSEQKELIKALVEALKPFADIPLVNIQYGKVWEAIDPKHIEQARKVLEQIEPKKVQIPF